MINYRDNDKHCQWLDECFEKKLIDQLVYINSIKSWYYIGFTNKWVIPIPGRCTGSNGVISYYWDKDEHHLELEISPIETAKFYYRNRATDEHWSEDYDVRNHFSERMLETMRLFY